MPGFRYSFAFKIHIQQFERTKAYMYVKVTFQFLLIEHLSNRQYKSPHMRDQLLFISAQKCYLNILYVVFCTLPDSLWTRVSDTVKASVRMLPYFKLPIYNKQNYFQ